MINENDIKNEYILYSLKRNIKPDKPAITTKINPNIPESITLISFILTARSKRIKDIINIRKPNIICIIIII